MLKLFLGIVTKKLIQFFHRKRIIVTRADHLAAKISVNCIFCGFHNMIISHEMSHAARGTNIANYNRLNEWPLQFMVTGQYYRSSGDIRSLTTVGAWWSGVSGSVGSAVNGHRMIELAGEVYAQANNWRSWGHTIRCVDW